MLILLCDNRILAVRGAIIRRSSLLCPKECQRKTRCYVLRFFNKCNTFNIDWASVLCSTLDPVLIGEAPVTDRSQGSSTQAESLKVQWKTPERSFLAERKSWEKDSDREEVRLFTSLKNYLNIYLEKEKASERWVEGATEVGKESYYQWLPVVWSYATGDPPKIFSRTSAMKSICEKEPLASVDGQAGGWQPPPEAYYGHPRKVVIIPAMVMIIVNIY